MEKRVDDFDFKASRETSFCESCVEGKLDAKSRKCVLLGYGTDRKGYRMYDSRRERVFYSRDVVFDESSRGIEKEQSVPERSSERYVELDFHDDEKHVADK